MAKTDFKYSSVAVFQQTHPDYVRFLSRIHLKNFNQEGSTKIWTTDGVGGKPSALFFDNQEGTEKINTTGAVTKFEEGNGGASTTTITSANHGLENLETIKITGTINYDINSIAISDKTADTFDIATTYVSEFPTSTSKWTLSDASKKARLIADKQWAYFSGGDVALDAIGIYKDSGDPNDDVIIETGHDATTYVEQQLTNGSMMLNSMITSHVTPIPKAFIYNNKQDLSIDAEYDYILQKAECHLAYSNMANAEGEFEIADRAYEQALDIINKINDGNIRLSYERESNDVKGKIIPESTNTGTMELIEVSGSWNGVRYDKLRIYITQTGSYGTGKFRVDSLGSNSLWETQSSSEIITGGMQPVNGLYIRFEGLSVTSGDVWYIEVRNDEPTNAQARSIDLWR